MKYILKIVVYQFLFAFILFSVNRILFLGLYWDLFQDLAFQEILISLIAGIRFDFSVLCKLLGLLNLVLFLPFSFRYNRFLLGLIAIIGNILMIIFLLIQMVDLGYYGIVGRRISFELFTMGTALGPTFDMVMVDHKIELLVTVLLVIFITVLWWITWSKLFRFPTPRRKPNKILGSVAFVFYFLILVAGGRGGFQEKPIVENAAFRNPTLVLGHLSLNAPFTVLNQFTQNQASKITWLGDEEAKKITRNLINQTEDVRYPMDDYTFYRQNSPEFLSEDKQKYNVVFIIMESWPAHSVGVLGAPHKDITPEFDALAAKGRLFPNFFSNGTRSIEGIAASLLSVAALPDLAFMMSSFEQNNIVALPALLGERGYDSLFLHGIFRGSFGMHEFAQRTGYKQVMAQQDFENYNEKSDGTWGIWDHIQFEQLIEEMDQMSKPFFTTMFSVSSHEPFVVPHEKFNYYPDSVPDYKWLNTLRYTDWAIGHFFELAKKKDWFENTLFIITSDHTLSGRADKAMDSARIPLILYSPSGKIQPGVDDRIGTQVDLIPTIMDFLDLESPHSSMGTSLLGNVESERYGLFNAGVTTWITNDMAYQFTGERLLGAYEFRKDWSFEHRLIDLDTKQHQKNITNYKAYLQSAQNALIDNRVSPKP